MGYRTLPASAYAPEPAPEPAYVYQAEPAPFVPYQPEPEPPAAVVRSAPLPVHPVFHQERAAYAAFMPVPAVPEDQFNQYQAVNWISRPTLPPALAPAPPAQAFSRAAEIVPVFNNEIPQDEPAMSTDPMSKLDMAALQSIFKMLKSFPAVPEDHSNNYSTYNGV